MSSFTPRSWKSQAEPQTEPRAEPPTGKFRAYKHGKPNNLPAARTPLIGREQEIAEITALLQAPGFATLVGAGGVGKTRCALQVAATVVDKFIDGVWFVDFAPIADSDLVASTVAQALDLPLSPNRPPLDTVVGYLKRKHVLLVLDNCEHVIEAARAVVSSILLACPQVHILATSREGLHVAGEQQYRMPSLAVPPASALLSAQEALNFSAARLFADRALAIDRRFVLSDDNAPYVSEICRRLDGIPLAIELAAARVNVLTPQQLAQRLDERFRVLTGGDRSALARHQTMRALIDWSYDLLPVQEQTLFRKLSIFAGGCTLQTATAVCGDCDELTMLERLSSLVEKSLLQAEPSDVGTRYQLLESTRQYGFERLGESGEYALVARAHALALLSVATDLRDLRATTSDRVWQPQAEAELDNWRAALQWTLADHGDLALGQKLVGAIWLAWAALGSRDRQYWIPAARKTIDASTPEALLAALELAEASLAMALAQHKTGYAAARRAVELFERLGDARGVVSAKRFAGAHLVYLGQVTEGTAFLYEALSAASRLDFHRAKAGVLFDLGDANLLGGDFEAARARYREALAIAKPSGFDREAALVARNLAELEYRSDDIPAALRLAGDALELFRALHNTMDCAGVLANLTSYLVAAGLYDEARMRARASLQISRDMQLEFNLLVVLQHIAAIAAFQPSAESSTDNCKRAAQLLGYVDARLAALESPARDYTERREYDRILTALRDALGEDEVAKDMAEGSTWSEDRAAEEALKE